MFSLAKRERARAGYSQKKKKNFSVPEVCSSVARDNLRNMKSIYWESCGELCSIPTFFLAVIPDPN